MTRVLVWAALLSVMLAAGGCGGGGADSDAAHWRPFDPDSVPEAYARSTAALGWPGATRAFQITPEGNLYNGAWTVRIDARAGDQTAGAPRRIAFEQRWRPLAHWVRRSGAVEWRFEAAALPSAGIDARDGGPPDSLLFATIVVEAVNHGDAAIEAALEATFAPFDSTAAFIAFDAPDSVVRYTWAAGAGDALAYAWSDAPHAGEVASATWTLAAGETRRARFVLPTYPAPAAAIERWAREPHERRVREARHAWNAEVERSMRLELGDPEVEHAYRAALVTLLTCQERRGEAWVPIGSPLHYRDVWLRDGARAIVALAIAGRGDEARRLATSFLHYQWPDGAFVSQRGQLDGTGQALWAIEQAMLRPEPAADVARFADAAARAWRWMEWQRGLGAATRWPFGAMMPFGYPRDAELVRAQLTGNDAFALLGYRATARLLRAAGKHAVADSVAESRVRYAADFAAALARTGRTDVPPSWQGIGRDWGNVATGFPCEALPVDDPHLERLARRLWAEAGGAGLLHYGPDTLHTYLGADLGTWALRAGHVDEADSVLAAMLYWRSASGGGGELFSLASRDYGLNPPPHATAAATLIALLRNTLVFDDGDTLELTLGARDRWWHGSNVEGAPTRWGVIDVAFDRRGEEAEWRWTAVPVWTRLHLPAHTVLGAAPDRPLAAAADGRAILAPPGTTRARAPLTEAPR